MVWLEVICYIGIRFELRLGLEDQTFAMIPICFSVFFLSFFLPLYIGPAIKNVLTD